MPRKKPDPLQVQHSCADCKHQFRINKDAAECRAHPMEFIPSIDTWASPPAPDDFLCGDHIIRCNS